MDKEKILKEKDTCEQQILSLRERIRNLQTTIQQQQQNLAQLSAEIIKKEGEINAYSKVLKEENGKS